MSVVSGIGEKVLGLLIRSRDVVKRRLFGANNERIDFAMDSFYKLSINNQKLVLITCTFVIGLIVACIFWVYFVKINTLEQELTDSFDAIRELRVLSADYKKESKRLEWLVDSINRKTTNFRPKSFFEQKAGQVGVDIEGLRDEETAINEESPLAANFKYVNVDFRLPKISLPRLIKFISEIERSDKGLVVKNLQIRARYGDRLYFDTQAKVTGYKVGGAGGG